MDCVIKSEKLTKYYGKSRGIIDIDLEVGKGEIFGFLGPNGAGKTTTIRILLDLIRPTSGKACVLGLDAQKDSLEIRKRLGYVPGDVVLYDGMTGHEYLKLMDSFHNDNKSKRIKELTERLELDLHRQTRAYSKGMKQKLSIIQAFMNDPELLVLDEPTSGLDPLVQHSFYDLLIEEKKRGKTIFLSSHILPEVERVCDRVGIVREGKIVSVESISALKHKKVRRLSLELSREVNTDEIKLSNVEVLRHDGNKLELKVLGDIPQLLKELCGLPIEDMIFQEAALEDVFMEYYKEENK